VQGLWQFLRGKNSWQLIDRVGLEPAPQRAP
jgi:hypothetical protein